jgi:hypothetical protein
MEQVNETLKQIQPYMDQIAPYMIISVYVAAGILAITVLSFVARILFGACNDMMRFASRLLILFGFVFLIYQGIDMSTGAGATAKETFYFYRQPFWLVATAILVLGVFFRLFATLRPTRECH